MFQKNGYRHPELGEIKIVVNRRARRIIMRAGNDGIKVTVPPFATHGDIEKALAKHGDRLKEIQATKSRTIGPQYSTGNGNFRIELQEYKGDKFMWVHNGFP